MCRTAPSDPDNKQPSIGNVCKMIITIDGPSGVGKSTVSKTVAQKLGLTYLDTGAMYRAVALQVKRHGTDIENEHELKEILDGCDISVGPDENHEPVFLLNGENVTSEIRTPEISRLSSDVATKRVVRMKLVELQREIGKGGNILAEGRDMGTYVFPDADYKFYLDASADERVKRRLKQLRAAGRNMSLEEVKNELEIRDRQDMERSESPLHPASNAVIIDTTNLLADEVINKIIKVVQG
jgi:cytidylate kinase